MNRKSFFKTILTVIVAPFVPAKVEAKPAAKHLVNHWDKMSDDQIKALTKAINDYRNCLYDQRNEKQRLNFLYGK